MSLIMDAFAVVGMVCSGVGALFVTLVVAIGVMSK